MARFHGRRTAFNGSHRVYSLHIALPRVPNIGILTMSSVPIGVIIVAILFGSALLAMVISHFLPDHQLSPETKSVVTVSTAVVGTLSALVVGLLISTASASFTAKTQEVMQLSADLISLDRLLRRYGVEAEDSRVLLRRYTAAKLQDLFPKNPGQAPNLENNATISMLEELQSKILILMPTNDTQRWLLDLPRFRGELRAWDSD